MTKRMCTCIIIYNYAIGLCIHMIKPVIQGHGIDCGSSHRQDVYIICLAFISLSQTTNWSCMTLLVVVFSHSPECPGQCVLPPVEGQ